MAFRSGGNNRRSGGGSFGGGFGGRNMNPWDQGGFGGGMRQGGGPMNADALSLANNLINNLLRNQNPPSLLDLPRGGGSMSGNRNRGQMGNRVGGNRSGNRRQGSGFGGGGGGNRGNQKSGGNNKGGIRKQNAFDRAKKLLAKNSNKKKDSADKTENKALSKESIYADVPNDMFYCHLCKKHMWDSNSFENHIKGRTHLMMREGIEESYRLKANMIRQEAKIAEQLKAIELDRLKRIGKSGKAMARDYCTMCDLNFHGHMTSHRKTDGHLALKKFLHPKCSECNKEFSTRIEFDTHLLTPDHLKKAAEKNTKVGERKKANLLILTEEEEVKDVRPPTKKKKKAETKKSDGEKIDEEKKENGEEGDGLEGDEEKKERADGEENKDAEMNETKEEEEEEEVLLAEDPVDCILDYHDGDEVPIEIEARLPKYNWTRPVGTSLIQKLECFECQLCAKFFDTEKTAEIHTRTVSHHRQFTKFLNEKSSDTKIAHKRAAAAIEESERKKRRIEEAAAAAEIKDDENGDKEDEENVEGGEDDLYDPSEATGDEDVEMNVDANSEPLEIKDEQNGKIEEIKQEEMETEEPEPIIVKQAEPEPQPETEPQPEAEPEPEPEPEPKPKPEPEVVEQEKPKPPIKAAPVPKTPTAKTPAKSTPRGKARGRGRYNY